MVVCGFGSKPFEELTPLRSPDISIRRFSSLFIRDNLPFPVITRNSLRLSAKSIATLVLVVGLFPVVGCNHTERYTSEMTWSSDANPVGLRRLPEGAVRLSFVQSPAFHVGLQIPGLKERLESTEKRIVPVRFEIQCKHRQFHLIRVRSVDGFAVQTTRTNMWLEKGYVDGPVPEPFLGACWY